MAATESGGDRQALHEKLRLHAVEVRRRVVEEGADNDLLERVAGDPDFAVIHDRLDEFRDPARFTGRAVQQTDAFLAEVVSPRLEAEAEFLLEAEETRV